MFNSIYLFRSLPILLSFVCCGLGLLEVDARAMAAALFRREKRYMLIFMFDIPVIMFIVQDNDPR